MKRTCAFALGVIALVLVMIASASYAGVIKVSKSNNLRLAWDESVVTPAQAAAILAEVKETVILILANPADEGEAMRIAISDPDAPNGKPPTSTKKK